MSTLRLATTLEADQLRVAVLAKVMFSFSPNIVMSPLALPRDILDRKIDSLLPNTHGALRDLLTQLKVRPTFEQQWPNQYAAGLAKGKARILKLERIRQDKFVMSDILQSDPEILAWWQSIA